MVSLFNNGGSGVHYNRGYLKPFLMVMSDTSCLPTGEETARFHSLARPLNAPNSLCRTIASSGGGDDDEMVVMVAMAVKI